MKNIAYNALLLVETFLKESDPGVRDDELKTFWPERNLYFYLEAIESYLPSGRVTVAGHGEMLMLGSYSYLGLNNHPRINAASQEAIERYGTGTHGARLLAGTLDLHRRLEARVAAFKSTEASVTYSTGFSANVSTVSALVGRGDTVISDKLNHASIVDGCLLSGARSRRFRHNDMADLERLLTEAKGGGRKLVIVDAVFSMDGDIIDLPAVSRLCRKHDAWLMVDEAHSIGVLGETGHGIEEHFDMPADTIDIKMGTLSKAIPSNGGYIAGSRKLCDYLAHTARGFIYSAALAPPAAAAALAAFDVIEAEPERIGKLRENVVHFARALRNADIPTTCDATPIFPIHCGENYQAFKLARYCQKRGIYVQAIPHPVVPRGKARLRAVVTADHRPADLDYCAGVFRDGFAEIGNDPKCSDRFDEPAEIL